MTKEEALKSYPAHKEVIDGYVDADKYCWVNTDDRDLHPVRIPLPTPPPWNVIHGFGKKAKDQVFEYEKYPRTLEILEEDVTNEVLNDKTTGRKSQAVINREILEKFWDELSKRQQSYAKEINWLKMMWGYRLRGKWQFIGGKPTYITGWFWFYLNWWKLQDEGRIVYRDRDRKWFLFVEYAYKDTTRPVKKSDGKKDVIVLDDSGYPKLEDVGVRICYGVNDIKCRRVGDTSKTACVNYLIISTNKEARGGIQGDSDDTGSNVFAHHIIFPFLRMKIIWKPRVKTATPKKYLEFKADPPMVGLDSVIDYSTTAHRSFYDGKKLKFYHGDEAGKVIREDLHLRHKVVRECLSKGSKIIGFTIYTTTVYDLSHNAGKSFHRFSEQSHWEDRDKNGRTMSGMYNLFLPATEGLDGFIGKYGESIIDAPTAEQALYLIQTGQAMRNNNGEVIGSKEFLENKRQGLRDQNDMEGLIEEQRLYPMSYREAFTPPAKNVFFDMDVITKSIGRLQNDNTATIMGDFVREDNDFDGRVVFMPHPKGKFCVSKKLDEEESNKRYKEDGEWWPEDPTHYVASADPYRLEKVDGGKMSLGGGAVKGLRDNTIDHDEVDIKEWTTNNIVCTYRNRPESLDEYCEDMLMMSQYYGSLMYPENNVDHVVKYFKSRGYGGYLYYDYNSYYKKRSNNPGFASLGASKQKLFNLVRDFIKRHGHLCMHIDFLEECSQIKNAEDMTNYDLFTAVGGCLLAEKSLYSDKNMRGTDVGVELGSDISSLGWGF